MLYADQTFRFRHRCGPRSDLWGAFPLYWGKTSLYFMTFPPMRMSSNFLWPFCLWTKRTPSTVLIGLCLLRTLLSMGFSPSLISWVKRLYTDIRSSIRVDGYVSPSFKPSRGAGCVVRLSSVVFALCAHHGGVAR